MNVIPVEPAGTETEPGTTTFDRLLLSLIRNPPFGATPFSVTVPVVGVPPVTEFGLKLIEDNPTGTIVKVAVWVVDPSVAVIVAKVVVVTGEAETVKVAPLWPAPIETAVGAVADKLLLLIPTTSPPGPAAALSMTLPVDVATPATVVGFRETDINTGAVIVSCEDCAVPSSVPVIVA